MIIQPTSPTGIDFFLPQIHNIWEKNYNSKNTSCSSTDFHIDHYFWCDIFIIQDWNKINPYFFKTSNDTSRLICTHACKWNCKWTVISFGDINKSCWKSLQFEQFVFDSKNQEQTLVVVVFYCFNSKNDTETKATEASEVYLLLNPFVISITPSSSGNENHKNASQEVTAGSGFGITWAHSRMSTQRDSTASNRSIWTSFVSSSGILYPAVLMRSKTCMPSVMPPISSRFNPKLSARWRQVFTMAFSVL